MATMTKSRYCTRTMRRFAAVLYIVSLVEASAFVVLYIQPPHLVDDTRIIRTLPPRCGSIRGQPSMPIITQPTIFHAHENNGGWETLDGNLDSDSDDVPPVPPDMVYVPRNVRRQHHTFLAIRQAAGAALTNDVYAREPGSETFWFVGKVARVSDVSLPQCVARQWSVIATHATNLRPLELFPSRGRVELWTAPGDSEMAVSYNRPDVVMTKMERMVPGADAVKNNMVGYQGEMYEPGEQGFRTWRTDDGRPARPEVETPNTSGMKTPSDADMKQLTQALQGQDINEFYKGQQRREGKVVDD